MENLTICPLCHQDILPSYYFCPNCGKELNEKPTPVSIPLQIGIYAISIFLPPLGLWPGIKYLRRKYPPARRVGIIAILLTVIFSALSVWGIFHFMQIYLDQLNAMMI